MMIDETLSPDEQKEHDAMMGRITRLFPKAKGVQRELYYASLTLSDEISELRNRVKELEEKR